MKWNEFLDLFEKLLQKERMAEFEESIREARILVDEAVSMIASQFGITITSKQTTSKVDSLIDQMKKNFPNDEDSLDSLGHLLKSISIFCRSFHHSDENTSKLLGGLRNKATHICMLSASLVSMCSCILDLD